MKDSKNEAVRAGRTQRCMGEVIERLVADARKPQRELPRTRRRRVCRRSML